MRRRHVGRTVSTLLLVVVVVLCAASCGTQSGSLFDGGAKPSDQVDASNSGPDSTIVLTSGPDTGTTIPGCSPQTCLSQGFTCGMNGDGCGAAIDCGSCTAPAFCGGGGRSQCGTTPNSFGDGGGGDGGTVCVPQTCAGLGFDCGFWGDGCGGTLQCGATCPAGEACGLGGSINQCVSTTAIAPDGGTLMPCVPTTCAALGFTCGPSGDGCGNLLDCSVGNPVCVSPQFCGGAGPGMCGGYNGHNADGGVIPPCTPATCASLGFTCGLTGDGCGNQLNCDTATPGCAAPEFCGGGGGNKCGVDSGAPPCVPKACAAGACGQKDDGCGNLVACPVTCTAPDTCGGSGTPFQCGHCPPGQLCNQQAACTAPATTTLTGTVRAGVSAWLAGLTPPVAQTPDPVPNVLVYIPNDPLPLAKMSQGYAVGAGACPQCAADVSGHPLVSTYTNFDGTFTLTNVPVGPTIPVVIQMGRWRRVFTVAVTTPCGANSAGTLNLPQNQLQGDIPLTAISTGNVDQLECVLLKMGIDPAEFTSNTATPLGRIHLYGQAAAANNGVPGAIAAGSVSEDALMGANADAGAATLPNYDQLMLPCWGAEVLKTAPELANLVTYADSGGHFFATHFSYTWLFNNAEFKTAATWDVNANANGGAPNGNGAQFTGNVQTDVPPSPPAPNAGVFEKWLALAGALSATVPVPQVTLTAARHDVDSPAVNASVDWIDGTDPNPPSAAKKNMLLHFTFDTPVPGGTCGHAIFSDFHVTGAGGSMHSNGMAFPTECTHAALTSQEKILEYMIWDLGACVGAPPPPVCNKLTCSAQNIMCDMAGDGCGGSIDCGSCPAGEVCGGGGVAGQCASACVPKACPANIKCGPWGDGCGALIPGGCGTCPPGETCGGGGVIGQCGAVDAGTCQPQMCPANIQCGPWGNGCGGVITTCGSCPPGETCGGGGLNGMCGTIDSGVCVPKGCPADIQCGPWGDGCGNLISCGVCTLPQTCGGGGVPGMCGGPVCTPLTCQGLGYNCGPAGDGCNGLLDCGTCPAGESCGGGGVSSVCGTMAPPK